MISYAETKRVFLLLGMACNFKCRYCIQRSLVLTGLSKKVSEETITFLQKLADEQPRNRRVRETLRVNLMGGEPLLYYETVCDLIKRVNRKNIEWAFPTNGSLVTPEIVDFINKNNIKIFLSHDGPQTEKLRGVDVLNNPEVFECLKAINRLGVDALITAYSQDIYALRKFINDKFERKIPIKTGFLNLASPVPEDIINYDLHSWKSTCELMSKNALKQFLDHEQGWESSMYKLPISAYYGFIEGRKQICSCSTFGNKINVDTKGRVWLCTDGQFLVGNTSSSCPELHQETEKKFVRLYQENKRYCIESCHWYPYCLGHCPRETMTAQQKKQCEFLGIFYASVESLIHEYEATSQNNFH